MKKHQGHPTLGGKPPAAAAPGAGGFVAAPGAANLGAVAKHFQKPHRTAKQIAEAHKRAEKAAKTRHMHEVQAKKLGKVARHKKVAKWSPNDAVACCAAQALAVSARLAGRDVSDADVLALYWLTADHDDAGATLEATIEAAGVFGLGGARLLAARPTLELATGTVLGVDLRERHALTVQDDGVWTWGAWRPATGALWAAADEAWELTWAGEA